MRKKISETELFELLAAKMGLEIEDFLEIVRPNLHCRFTDLERRLRHGMLPLLSDQNTYRRRLQMQLPGQTQPGETSAQDHHIVGSVSGWRHNGSILRRQALFDPLGSMGV